MRDSPPDLAALNRDTIRPSTTGGWPADCILRVEPQTAHKEFLDAMDYVEHVMLSITRARTLVNRGETAASYFGDDITVIVTTTMHDAALADWDWTKERDVIRSFQPDFHIPTDYPVYWRDTPSQRRTNTKKCLKGTLWMIQELADTDITILPLLKGTTPQERALCYKVFQALGVTYCAFYGTQYLTSGKGITPLTRDLRRIAGEAPSLDILLIGLLDPDRLAALPPQVVAAAGLHQWISRVSLRDDDVSRQEQQQRLTALNNAVDDACTGGQTPLGMWTGEPLYEEEVIHG